MPRLTPLHWKVLDCIFKKYSFKFERETDTHRVYSKPTVNRPVIIPKYDEVGVDIIRCNMRTAGMTREEYFKLLEKCK